MVHTHSALIFIGLEVLPQTNYFNIKLPLRTNDNYLKTFFFKQLIIGAWRFTREKRKYLKQTMTWMCFWGSDLCVSMMGLRVQHNFDNPTSSVLLPCVSLPWRFSLMTVQLPCVPTPMGSFLCFLLTTVSMLLSLVWLLWLCSCATVSSVRGADIGGARRGKGNLHK